MGGPENNGMTNTMLVDSVTLALCLVRYQKEAEADLYAWPEVWRPSDAPMAISTPRPDALFIICMTLVSLPGMILAEYSSRSVGLSLRRGDACRDAKFKADLGSACTQAGLRGL